METKKIKKVNIKRTRYEFSLQDKAGKLRSLGAIVSSHMNKGHPKFLKGYRTVLDGIKEDLEEIEKLFTEAEEILNKELKKEKFEG